MSKKRPSKPVRSRAAAVPDPAPTRADLAYWRRRLFRNTYTYRGRRARVGSWSTKIQHEGQRRTFSLIASRKEEAAREAHQLYHRLVTQGWDAIGAEPSVTARARASPVRTELAAAKGTASFWKQRLVRRPYGNSTASFPASGFSARIQHGGAAWYFSLGSDDAGRAAEQAKQIYLTVVRDGWVKACASFSREATVAIHWAASPLVWTYAALHTLVQPSATRRDPAGASERIRVVVIESDAGIRAALACCINRHPNVGCVAVFGSAESAVARSALARPQLVLVNHHLPDMEGPRCVERLRPVLPDSRCLLFSVYEDSGELFKSTPGGSAGYFLKRTPPDQLLAPLSGMITPAVLSAQQISRAVWNYVQESLASLQRGEAAAEMEKLTPRECQVLDCLSRGYVDKEIATALGISAWTVHGHVKNIFEKLAVHSRTEAVVKYLQR